MPAKRFPRLSRAIVPMLVMTVLNAPIHPAQATPAALDSTLDVRLGRSAVAVLPMISNLVSVSVPSKSPSLSLRIADDQGEWHRVTFDDDHGPDPIEGVLDAKRRFSDPIWIGTADLIRMRQSSGTPRALRLHLINTLGVADDAAPLGFVKRAWQALTVPRYAEALVPDQDIVTRSEWGADESWVDGRPGPALELKAIFVHHTDSGNGYSRSQVPAMLRGIYRYHTKTRGWSDIGYNFLIDRFGRIYEGRGGGITLAMIGAHARGANDGSSGIALLGNFSNAEPSAAMKRGLAQLIAWKADWHHIPVIGKVSLSGTRYDRVSGHRDANPTACPGNKAYGLLSEIRKAAHNYGLPKMYLPRTSTDLVRRDGDGAHEVMRLLAWGSESLNWTIRITDQSGIPVHQQTFSGRELEIGGKSGLVWRGTDQSGRPVPSGRYRWSIEGINAAGAPTRGATGDVTVITDHFPGTLLSDGAGVYLISETPLGAVVAEPLSALDARTRFRSRLPIDTGPGERSRYGTTPGDGLRIGALLLENGNLLIVSASNEVSTFAPGAATALGFRKSAALAVSTEDLASVARRVTPITETSRHPAGTYVSAPLTDGSIEYSRIRTADRSLVRRSALLGRGVMNEVVPATPGDLALPRTGGTEDAPDGSIFRMAGGSIWLISSGERHKVLDLDFFASFGYSVVAAISANHADISHLPVGERIG